MNIYTPNYDDSLLMQEVFLQVSQAPGFHVFFLGRKKSHLRWFVYLIRVLHGHLPVEAKFTGMEPSKLAREDLVFFFFWLEIILGSPKKSWRLFLVEMRFSLFEKIWILRIHSFKRVVQ